MKIINVYIYTVQILEKFDDNWTIARGALDASITSKESKQSKRQTKKVWVLKLRIPSLMDSAMDKVMTM